MVKVLANKVLAFDRGEKNEKGNLIREKTKVGFCELPDWAQETDLFKAAIVDKSILAVGQSSESESVLKEQEKLAVLQDQVKALEEKRDLIAASIAAEKKPKVPKPPKEEDEKENKETK